MSHIPWDGSDHCLMQSFSRSLAVSVNIEVFYAKRKTFSMSNGEKCIQRLLQIVMVAAALGKGGVLPLTLALNQEKRGLNVSLLV